MTSPDVLELVAELAAGAVQSALDRADGDLWISELGWATPGVDEHAQRAALATTFDYLQGQAWRVRMAVWYQVGDTPSEGGFGLIRPHYMDEPGDPMLFKLSWTEFQDQAVRSAP